MQLSADLLQPEERLEVEIACHEVYDAGGLPGVVRNELASEGYLIVDCYAVAASREWSEEAVALVADDLYRRT